jgi:hypothetical protein
MPNSLEWIIKTDTDKLTSEGSYHVGETYSVIYELKSNLPVPAPIAFITTGSDAAFKIEGCSGQLSPSGTCELTVTFAPTTMGDKRLFLEANLAGKLFIILDKTFTVLPAKEVKKAEVNAKVKQDLDSVIPVGMQQDIAFLFTNDSETPATGVSVEITVEEEGG